MKIVLAILLVLISLPSFAKEIRFSDKDGNTTGYAYTDRYGTRITDSAGNTRLFIENAGPKQKWIRDSTGDTRGYYNDPSVLRPTLGDD